uniref:Rx_N domain-containing protein n=1 Tax=Bursaphelenchus xylophilus TaxID=6326 RepID=A0A1I7SIM4_BURXY
MPLLQKVVATSLVAKVHHYLKKLFEDGDDEKTINTVRNTVEDIIQTTVEAIGLGSEIITQIRVLGALADNDERLNEIVESCLIIEKVMLKMSNDWEYVETVWSEEKQRLEIDVEPQEGTLKKKKPEEAPKKVDHGKLGAQLNGIETWLNNSKKKLKKDPKYIQQVVAEGK